MTRNFIPQKSIWLTERVIQFLRCLLECENRRRRAAGRGLDRDINERTGKLVQVSWQAGNDGRVS